MKITRAELKKIISEEAEISLDEGFLDKLTGGFKYSQEYLAQAREQVRQDVKALKKYRRNVSYKLDPEYAEEVAGDIDRGLPKVEDMLKKEFELGTGFMSRDDRNDLLKSMALVMAGIWRRIEMTDEQQQEMARQKKELYADINKEIEKRNALLRKTDANANKKRRRPKTGGSVAAGFKDQQKFSDEYSGYGESINREGDTNMKITRGELKKIIAEETHNVLEEGFLDSVMGFFGKMSNQDKKLVKQLYAATGEFMDSDAFQGLYDTDWNTPYGDWDERDAEVALEDVQAAWQGFQAIRQAEKQIRRKGTRAAKTAAAQLLDPKKGVLGTFNAAIGKLSSGGPFEQHMQKVGIETFNKYLQAVGAASNKVNAVEKLRAEMEKATQVRKGKEAAERAAGDLAHTQLQLGIIALSKFDRNFFMLDDKEKETVYDILATGGDTLIHHLKYTEREPMTDKEKSSAKADRESARTAMKWQKSYKSGGRRRMSTVGNLSRIAGGKKAVHYDLDESALRHAIQEELAKVLQGK